MTTWLPKGLRCDDGKGKEVAKMYGLLEAESGYRDRDRKNAGILCFSFSF
jgi:hypothetical protein